MARASIPSTSRVNLTRSCILFHFYIKPQLRNDTHIISVCCILFHFYIKPQLNVFTHDRFFGCILFHFYIKPQPVLDTFHASHGCILFHFYIKPQLTAGANSYVSGCILFHFYIKPQPLVVSFVLGLVVSYSISTSNHNYFNCCSRRSRVVSYSISTSNHNPRTLIQTPLWLYLIPFLHQTTTIAKQVV